MKEEERLAAERVSCAAAGCLLLMAGGALVWGACLRWPWLPKAAGMLAAVGAAAAVVWVLAGGWWRGYCGFTDSRNDEGKKRARVNTRHRTSV